MRELKRPPRLATQKSRTGVFSLPSDARKRVKINRAFFVQIHLLLSQMIQISIGDTFRNHVNQQLKSGNKKTLFQSWLHCYIVLHHLPCHCFTL